MERFRGDSKKSQQNILEAEKLLAAWFSSTLFLALYLYYRREISGDYGRIKIGDMTSFPCINPSKVAEEDKVAILREFEAIKSKQLPTIFDQLKTRTLWRMDLALLRALGIDESTELLEKLYADLLAELNKTEVEEESPSTRT
jgi:hypothetical protein